MVIVIKTKNVYGNDLHYPMNYVDELKDLTGSKTLTLKHIQALKGLGFTFQQEEVQL